MPGDGLVFLEALRRQRWTLHKLGVRYADWRLMTRWQRVDMLRRHGADLEKDLLKAGEGLGPLLGVLAGRILGM